MNGRGRGKRRREQSESTRGRSEERSGSVSSSSGASCASVNAVEDATDGLSPTVCHLCRQRKTKCDRKRPRCGFCIKAKVECRYVQRVKRRGLRAGYVSELEARIERLEKGATSTSDGLKNLETEPQRETPSALIGTPSAAVATPTWPSVPLTPVTPLTPYISASPASSARRQQFNTGFADAAAAIHDMTQLPRAYFFGLVDTWFKEYAAWAPFLRREQVNASLETLPDPVDRIDDVVLKAVIAIEIAYSSAAICLGYSGRRRLSSFLRSQVLIEAIGRPSLSSLQALLVIALLDYGADDIPSTFSLMAMVRRMAENIGIFRQLLNRIEGESPTQVGPPAHDHCEDEIAIAVTWCILALDAVSSLGVPWRDASAALVDHLSSIAYITSKEFRDSFRTHTHLAAIGLQPVHEFLHLFSRNRIPSTGSYATMCEEMHHNLMSYVHGLPESSYTFLADGVIDYDPCQLFTRMLAHGAIILVYQRFLFSGDGTDVATARTRCFESRTAMINVVRNMSDIDTEVNSPLLVTFMYIAARYELCLCRRLSQPRDSLFDVLMHGINMCGRRWPLARRIDIVLRAAIHEVDYDEPSSLPADFWDLSRSHLDISEATKDWVDRIKPSLFVGALNGPYV